MTVILALIVGYGLYFLWSHRIKFTASPADFSVTKNCHDAVHSRCIDGDCKCRCHIESITQPKVQ